MSLQFCKYIHYKYLCFTFEISNLLFQNNVDPQFHPKMFLSWILNRNINSTISICFIICICISICISVSIYICFIICVCISICIGSVYWQTVTVCQLEIIGRPCQKYQKIFMGTSALPQSFEQCSNSCSFVQSIRGLPIRRNWQNDYIFCERSANNL